ncbi:MAG: ATP-binding protein [Lachnospiraceae bacterium]|nr:ATP-binding protein [Lachnospiraceae bacterium]
MGNPYTITFGKEPSQSIPRFTETNEILDAFLNDPPNQQTFLITGVRGSGKTVLMTEIRKKLQEEPDWITVELSTSQDLLLTLAQTLYNDNRLSKLLKQGGGISVLGFGVQLNSAIEIQNPTLAIKSAMDKYAKQHKKLLICIDEVISNDTMKEFSSIYQILLREDYPIYLVMTGLYDNINDLRNEKNLTFLYRVPEVRLRGLNLSTIAANYAQNLPVSESVAKEMAALTKGYSFAFQVLGYFTYRYNGDHKAALPEYRQYLEDYVYEKIWSELSAEDKKLLRAIVSSESGKAKEIKEFLGWSNEKYAPYRDRLIKKMIVDGTEYGHLKLTLPLMEDFVQMRFA